MGPYQPGNSPNYLIKAIMVMLGFVAATTAGYSVAVGGGSTGGILFKESTAAGTPASGERVLYAKSGGLYQKDSSGTESSIGGVSAPLTLTGTTDVVQLTVKANGTQTANVFAINKSTGASAPYFVVPGNGYTRIYDQGASPTTDFWEFFQGNFRYYKNGLGYSIYIEGDDGGGSSPAAVRVGSTGLLTWQSTNRVDTGSVDTGLARAAANVFTATNGSSGVGDYQAKGSLLTAGTLTETNKALARKVIHRYDWTNAMVVALGAGLTGDVTVCTLPAKTVVTNAYIVITGAGSGTATLTVALGRTSASYIDYIVASDAKASANTVYGDASGERGTNLTGYDLPSYTGTTAVKLHFISTVDNLDQVTGSTGAVYIETMTIP